MAEVAENGAESTEAVGYEQTFSDKIIREDLPPFLQRVFDSQEDAVGRDKMLLGVLCLVSIFINTAIYAIYDGRKVFAALYLIIYGRFATSKGDLEAVRQVAAPINNEMRRLGEWNKEDDIFDSLERAVTCDERDFNAALTITECLVSHTARVYAVLCSEDNGPFRNCARKPSERELQYYKALPEGRDFKAKEAGDIALSLGIPKRTADRYLGNFSNKYLIIKRIGQGYYTKIPQKEQQ